jgi:hypothetical protein
MILRRHPLPALLAIGLASQLVYLAYTLLFPLTSYGYAPRPYDMEQIARNAHWMGASWMIGLVVLYVLFGVAVWVVDASRWTRRVIFIFGLMFGLTLVWLYPVTATDLFQYVMRARIGVVYGANPMAVTPEHFPNDPLLPFVGEWKNIVSPYGPAWELLAGAVARLGFTGAVLGALAYKAVAWLAYLACLALLAWGTRPAEGNGNRSRALLFFAWNPLVLLQGVGNGHNDLVMLAWLLLAVVIWQRRWPGGRSATWLLAVAGMSVAVLVKAAAGMMAILLLAAMLRAQVSWRRRALMLAGSAGLGVGLALLAYLPFWPPWQSINGVLDEMANRYTYTIAATLRMGLDQLRFPPNVTWDVPRAVGEILSLAVLAWCMMQVWRRRLDLASAGFLAYFAYLIDGSSYRIWYPLWLVPLAALNLTPAVRWRTLLLCFTSEFSIVVFYYVWRWYWPDASWLEIHLLTIPWQFGVPLLLPIWLRRRAEPGAHAARPL